MLNFYAEFLPYEISYSQIRWLKVNCGIDFTLPFFHQAIENCKSQRVITTLETLLTCPNVPDNPSGMIFHVGRCGSTMVSNLIHQLPSCYVLKEPQPLSGALAFWAMQEKNAPDTGELIFKKLMGIYISHFVKRNPKALVFIKFPSWACSYMHLALAAYPNIPILFIFRKPEHVVVSMLKTNTTSKLQSFLPFASSITGISEGDVAMLSKEEFLAKSLRQYMEMAVGLLKETNNFKINYSSLSVANLTKIVRFFGIEESDDDLKTKIDHSLKFYSKDANKRKVFYDDSILKENYLSPSIRMMVRQHTDQVYEELVRSSF